MDSLSCDETAVRLSGYLDRELSDEDMAQVRVHLKACPPCETIYDFQAELKRLVRKECCADDAPVRLREWVRNLAFKEPTAEG